MQEEFKFNAKFADNYFMIASISKKYGQR